MIGSKGTVILHASNLLTPYYSLLQRSKLKSINYKMIPDGKVISIHTSLRLLPYFVSLEDSGCFVPKRPVRMKG